MPYRRSLPLSTVISLSLGLSAQTPLRSPEVHPDRTVTFRLAAPTTSAVSIFGEWTTSYNTLPALTKASSGVWSITVGPLEPGIYSYALVIDGLAVLDPNNPAVQTGRSGAPANLLEVRGDTPQPWEQRPVPHGDVHVLSYNSAAGLGDRKVVVYTPPDYSPTKRYPVLYLLGGSGDTEMEWIAVGKADRIADNLLAAGRITPMIIVMPDGHAASPGAESPPDSRQKIEKDLLASVIPLIDARFKTDSKPARRAIAGVSMGAFQALWYALGHPETFGSLALFGGGGAPGNADEPLIAQYATSRKRPGAKPFQLFTIATGALDRNRSLTRGLDSLLAKYQVPHEYHEVPNHGHTWPFWRLQLAGLLPRLFPATK